MQTGEMDEEALSTSTGTAFDIDERAGARQRLEASEERFRLLVEEAPDAILIYDFDRNRFLSANKAAERLFGCSRDELMRYGPKDFLTFEQPDGRPLRETFDEHSATVLAGQQAVCQRRIRNTAGEERLCDVTLIRLPAGAARLMRASLVDITERRQAERQLAAQEERWRKSLEATVGGIASTFERRDLYTAGHQRRVAKLAVAIAAELDLPQEQTHGLYLAAVIHDVGKIMIPAEILSKPAPLSPPERQLIEQHAEAGYEIVKDIDFPWPIAETVRQHHERLDGSGYPRRLTDDAILPTARILAVADVVESMMSHRPYRPALGLEAALFEIEAGSGSLYDAAAVAACTALFRKKGFEP
jgi:PAS domain S-box-containing protein/putative nucleotidyltransferase with HDIG domain